MNLWTAASISGGWLRSGTSYAAPFVTAALAVEQMRTPGQPIGDAISRRRLLLRVGLAAGAAYAAPIPPLPSPAPCRRG